MKRSHLPPLLSALASLALLGACTVESPFDPAGLLGDLNEALDDLGRSIDDALKDPLKARPFPVLVGGNSQEVFYATNLTDIRVKFSGKSNDVVIPGLVGPSNLYEFSNRQRELVRPLIASGAFGAIATDGRFVAYVAATRKEELFEPTAVVAGDLGVGLDDQVVFQADAQAGEHVAAGTLALSDGRVAFNVYFDDRDDEVIRVVDLLDRDPTLEIAADWVFSLQLLDRRLAWVESGPDGDLRVLLRNVNEEESLLVAGDIRSDFPADQVRVFLTNNGVVWSEPVSPGVIRVLRFDPAEALTRVWIDAAVGVLAGASDGYFVTQEYLDLLPEASNRIIVRRYAADGTVKKLADFRADGLAGQTHVIGDRAAWVNPDREIVLAPLAGGDRTLFSPY